jgi:hypothetical protein
LGCKEGRRESPLYGLLTVAVPTLTFHKQHFSQGQPWNDSFPKGPPLVPMKRNTIIISAGFAPLLRGPVCGACGTLSVTRGTPRKCVEVSFSHNVVPVVPAHIKIEVEVGSYLLPDFGDLGVTERKPPRKGSHPVSCEYRARRSDPLLRTQSCFFQILPRASTLFGKPTFSLLKRAWILTTGVYSVSGVMNPGLLALSWYSV